MTRFAIALAWVFVFSFPSSPSAVCAQDAPHQLRLEAGTALMLPPQSDRFRNAGFSAGVSYGYRLTSHFELVGRYGAALWARERLRNAGEDRFGAAHLVTASARGHFLGADAPVDLWASAGLGLAVTAAHGRLELHADVGLDVPVSATWSIGPYARLHWIVEPDGGAIDDRDAAFIELGVGAGFRPRRSEEAAAREPEPDVTQPEPAPEPEVAEPAPDPEPEEAQPAPEPEPEPEAEPEPEVAEPEPEPEAPLSLYFGVGSDQPSGSPDATIERALGVLARYPEARIRLEGYADEYGDAEYNQRLSQRRADLLEQRLVEAGVDADRITAVGHGEVTGGAARRNRRVDFVIIDLPPGAEL